MFALLLAVAAVPLESYESNSSLRPLCLQQSVACAAYIQGVADMLLALADRFPHQFGALYCPPAKVTSKDLSRVYLEYLKAQKEAGNYSAAESITSALTTAYPCASAR